MSSYRRRAVGDRRVYLRPYPQADIDARHSSGARVRTAHLLGFLLPLQRAAKPVLEPSGAVSLVVAHASDWRRIFSYPYGLPFTRNLPDAAVIVAAADYPERLLTRFDDPLLRAAKAGARAPGHVGELLDLMIGHEWGHAIANRSGLRTGVKWLDEFMATYVFVQALLATGGKSSHELLAAWAGVQVAADAELKGALDDFEYPRGRMGLAQLLWFQGVFTQRALALAPERGWSLALQLREALPAEHKGRVSSALVEIEPSFKSWFAVFGAEPDADLGRSGAAAARGSGLDEAGGPGAEVGDDG